MKLMFVRYALNRGLNVVAFDDLQTLVDGSLTAVTPLESGVKPRCALEFSNIGPLDVCGVKCELLIGKMVNAALVIICQA